MKTIIIAVGMIAAAALVASAAGGGKMKITSSAFQVWNIDPKTTEIAEGSLPQGGVQGTNDFPGHRFDGPQPPSGTHRYYFKIFALDKTLDLKPGAKRREVDAAIKGHVIAQGQLMGKYSKK